MRHVDPTGTELGKGPGFLPDVEIEVVLPPDAARVAPMGVELIAHPKGFGLVPDETALAYDPAIHELEYEWEFGEPGARFTAPADKLPPEYLDANRAVGQRTAHVYTRPGRYKVTCRAYRVLAVDPEIRTLDGQGTAEIVVGEAGWGADDTVIYDPTAQFVGAPDGHRATTRGAGPRGIYGKVKELSDRRARRVRVLLPRGQRLGGLEAFRKLAGATNLEALFFDAWGEGAPPEIRALDLPPKGGRGYIPLTFSNLTFAATYDSTTQTDQGDGKEGGRVFVNAGAGGYWLFHGCIFRNGGSGIVIAQPNREDGAERPARLFLHACRSTDLAKYTLFWNYAPPDDPARPTGGLFALGNRFAHNPRAIHGTFSREGNVNAQGNIRLGAEADAVVRGSYFFSIQGWTPNWPNWSDGVRRTAFQPNLRLGEGGFGHARRAAGGRPASYTVSRSVFDGSGVISVASVGNLEPPLVNILITQNLFTGPFGGGIQIRGAAATVACNLQVRPSLRESRWRDFVRLILEEKGGLTERDVLREPIRIFNNTTVVLTDDAHTDPEGALVYEQRGEGGRIPGLWPRLVAENNLVYAPHLINVDIWQASAGRVDRARILTTTSWLGRKEAADAVVQTRFAVSDPIATYEGDRPLRARTLPLARTDLLGRPRTSPTTGALRGRT